MLAATQIPPPKGGCGGGYAAHPPGVYWCLPGDKFIHMEGTQPENNFFIILIKFILLEGTKPENIFYANNKFYLWMKKNDAY